MANFPSLGDRFEDRFEILAHVAGSGVSRLYRANHIGLGREVALKILRPTSGSDGDRDRERFEEWARDFEHEAHRVCQLRDSHTVSVHDCGRTGDGLWFIVFELIDGRATPDECLDEPSMAEGEVDPLLQVLASLEEAHHHEVQHAASALNDSNKSGSDAKVSELTMLGVEQMLRSAERDGGRRWRLGCAVAAVLTLVVSGGLGVMLYSHAGSLSTMPQAGEELVKEWVIYPVSDSVAPEDRFSIRGLQLAIESADWRPQGVESVVETPQSRKVMQTYTHKRQRVHAAFHNLSDRSAARKLVDQTSAPARAVRCDTKVVVLEPATAADTDYVEGLVLLLENYCEAVISASADR